MTWTAKEFPDTIALFDVDGTLTPARQFISPEMKNMLAALRKKIVVGFVGGSDLVKQKEQIGEDGKQLFYTKIRLYSSIHWIKKMI
jgi:phosphomannomutase